MATSSIAIPHSAADDHDRNLLGVTGWPFPRGRLVFDRNQFKSVPPCTSGTGSIRGSAISLQEEVSLNSLCQPCYSIASSSLHVRQAGKYRGFIC